MFVRTTPLRNIVLSTRQEYGSSMFGMESIGGNIHIAAINIMNGYIQLLQIGGSTCVLVIAKNSELLDFSSYS